MTNFVRLYSIRLAWWNLGISPPGSSSSKQVDYDALVEDLSTVFFEHDNHFLGVCEVSGNDISELEKRLPSTLSIINLNNDAGRTRFDTAVLYDNTHLSVNFEADIQEQSCGQTIKAGQKLRITEKQFNDEFIVYVCHWASRLRTEGEVKRKLAANLLYESSKNHTSNDERVIILGDFNDNPYDPSLKDGLKASRCHELVKSYRKELFYNPFWRSIVSESKYNYTLSEAKDYFYFGSHKYKAPFDANWHSYDQIILSGSFLGGDAWHLHENQTKVMNSERFLSYLLSKDSHYDHLPVTCEILRHEV
ncbi:endonuclease/exonuclease/phosphatase family protein [Photobacterium leiognathi]|uniref:endonuclease/exonuclease/phosphatase family protein n=1 Tax=Photobacterium leiognathi TaxID=553611 RepID=UPI002982B892|nr:endonuclease/exonuclease/phosphatase [Photobacterium leiognathi]